jgi:ABC-type lipoprotein release transport system permease subunit
LIIAAINFVLSTIATFAVCIVLNNIILASLPVDIVLLNVGIRQLILIAGVSVLSAFLGSFLPTSKISRKRPIDAINNR